MANRYYNNQAFTLSPAVVKVFCNIFFTETGVPTIVRTNFNSKGLVSITKDDTGLYTFVFGTKPGMLDVYCAMLSLNYVYNTVQSTGGLLPNAPLLAIRGNNISNPSLCSIQVGFFGGQSLDPTDPVKGESLFFEFTFKNSTAP